MASLIQCNVGKKNEVNQVILILYSFTPFYMNFSAILMPKVILAKILSDRSYSYLKYALAGTQPVQLVIYLFIEHQSMSVYTYVMNKYLTACSSC